MKRHYTSYIIILLALSIIHTGFASAESMLCQNRCELSKLAEAGMPPCCKQKAGENHSAAMTERHDVGTSDCPHVGSSKRITDPLPLLTVQTFSPTPDTLPSYTGVVLSPLNQFHPTGSAVRPERTGLPPPGLAAPPYYLYCSLLI